MSNDLKLVHWDYSGATTGVSYSFDQNVGATRGRESLIQYIIKNILTLKGTNLYEPQVGSSIPALPKTTVAYGNDSGLRSLLTLGIKNLEADVKKAQREEEELGGSLADYEKLKSIVVSLVKYNISTGNLKVTLDVYTQDEGVSSVNVTL